MKRQKNKFGKGSFLKKPQLIADATLFLGIPSIRFCSGTSPGLWTQTAMVEQLLKDSLL